jgi:hypothetical protein
MLFVSSAQNCGLLQAERRLVCNRHHKAGADGRDAGRGAAPEAARDHDQILTIESADRKPCDHVHVANAHKEAHAMPSRAAEFRKRAADALRNGRNARHASDRDTHFDAAASYKALALEEEWLRGDRQRSIARKNK